MTSYARIQFKIDRGLGHAGQKLGQPYTAYRLNASASGDFPGGWPVVATNVPIFRRRINAKEIESALEYGGTVWYDIIANMVPFVLGDTFLCIDAAYVPGVSYGPGATSVNHTTYELNALCFAWHFPVHKPVGARIDRRAQIYRPDGSPSTMTDGTLAWRQANDKSQPLVLSAGAFSFGSAGGTGSYVPCGIASTARPGRGEMFEPDTPGMPGITRYYAYLPYLPGYEPAEGDRLITEDGARYVVQNPYRQEQGVVGSQLVLERMIAQIS